MYKAVEKYNINNLKKLASQNKFTLEEIINSGGRCKSGQDYYYVYILQCLQFMLLCPNGNRITYKFAKDCDSGRQYAKPFGIQNLPHNIRDFIIQDMGLIDYDMKNCHFSILHKLCIKHSINAPIIAEIFNDRDSFLKNHKINKIKLLTILNTDKPVVYHTLNDFVKELDSVKTTINTLYSFFIIFIVMAGATSILLFLLHKKLEKLMHGIN